MSRSVTASSAKRKPTADKAPRAWIWPGVKARTSLCAKESTRLILPPISGSSTAANTKPSSVSESPATVASTEPCRPRSPSRRATRAARIILAASMRGIRPEPCAARATSLCSTAPPSAVSSRTLTSKWRARPSASAWIGSSSTSMRSADTASAMRASWGSSAGGVPGGRGAPGVASAAGSAVGHHDGTLPAGAWGPARGRTRVRMRARHGARGRLQGRHRAPDHGLGRRWRGGASRRARRRSCC